MKNILGNKTPRNLHGRLRYSTEFASKLYLQGKKILEVGCGFGWFLVHGINCEASSVTGIELTESDLSVARADDQLSKAATLKVGTGLNIPFEDGSFDVVLSWEVLEHIPKNTESHFFSEINRVLAPGGIFFLSTPNHSLISTYLDPAYWLVNHRHYKIKSIISLAEKNGFLVEEIKLRGSWFETLAIYNLYISKWIFRRGPFFEEWQNKKLDYEWKKDMGFMTIMTRMRKTPSQFQHD